MIVELSGELIYQLYRFIFLNRQIRVVHASWDFSNFIREASVIDALISCVISRIFSTAVCSFAAVNRTNWQICGINNSANVWRNNKLTKCMILVVELFLSFLVKSSRKVKSTLTHNCPRTRVTVNRRLFYCLFPRKYRRWLDATRVCGQLFVSVRFSLRRSGR